MTKSIFSTMIYLAIIAITFTSLHADDLSDAQAFYDSGTAFFGLQDFDKAIENYTQAIQLNPNEAKYYYHRCQAYMAAGDIENFVKDMSVCINLDTDDPETKEWIAQMKSKMSETEQNYQKDPSLKPRIIVRIVTLLVIIAALIIIPNIRKKKRE